MTHIATRPVVLLGALVGAAAIGGGCGQPLEVREPATNVVVISVDTLRPDFLGAGGDPSGTSPALDRLAARGAQFPGARSTSSWTLPAHMSLLTGQYPSSHGVTGDGASLPAGKRTLAQTLSERGYRTGGFVSGPYLHRAYGFDRGFDVYAHCMDYGVALNDEGRVANVIRANQLSHRGQTGPDLHRRATEWLATVPDHEPYFLFVHYWDPHYDFEPSFPWDRWIDPDWKGRFRADGFLTNRRIAPDMSPERRKRLLDLYRGEIRATDEWIGALLDVIESRGETDRTLIVVTADHGEEFFEHGAKGHRNNLYDESLRVPLVVTGVAALGKRGLFEDPVSLVDVVPTLERSLDVPPSEEIQGIDLAGIANGEVERAGVAAELHRVKRAFVASRWKLLVDQESGREEIYALDSDPGEANDLRDSAKLPAADLVSGLEAAALDRWAPEGLPEAPIDAATEERLRALGYTD